MAVFSLPPPGGRPPRAPPPRGNSLPSSLHRIGYIVKKIKRGAGYDGGGWGMNPGFLPGRVGDGRAGWRGASSVLRFPAPFPAADLPVIGSIRPS